MFGRLSSYFRVGSVRHVAHGARRGAGTVEPCIIHEPHEPPGVAPREKRGHGLSPGTGPTAVPVNVKAEAPPTLARLAFDLQLCSFLLKAARRLRGLVSPSGVVDLGGSGPASRCGAKCQFPSEAGI